MTERPSDRPHVAPASRGGPWGLVAGILPLAAVLLSRLQIVDLAYQIRAGQLMVASGSLLRTDVFSYTNAGAPWLNQQWGAQLLLARAFGAAGWRGLLFLQGALVAGSLGVTYRRTRAEGAAAVVAACACLAGFVVAAILPGALALRPQLLVLPLFIASAWIIRSRRETPRRMAILPLIGLVWANLHGSFVLLPVLLGIAFVADVAAHHRLARWTGALSALSLVTPLATPWGIDIYRYVFEVSSRPIVRQAIAEWRPVLTRVPAGPVFVVLCVIAGIVLARRGTRRPTLEEAMGLAVFTLLALWSGRNLLWWSVFVPPVLGGMLAGWQPGSVWSRRATRAVAAVLAALLALGVFRVATYPTADLLTEAPAGITARLATLEHDGGRVFADWWGWWFEFALPGVPMFVDARVETFPDVVWHQYLEVVNAAPGWQTVLDRWHVDVVVASTANDSGLIAALSSEPGWSLVYRDTDGAIFQRSAPS